MNKRDRKSQELVTNYFYEKVGMYLNIVYKRKYRPTFSLLGVCAQIEQSEDLICKKQIILRLLTDLEPVLQDRSRGGNQKGY